MKKLFLITILLSNSAFAGTLDSNTSQNCQDSKNSQNLLLIANNPGGCCAAHKGNCGCSPEGAICCDGTKAPIGCPCDDSGKKK